MTASRLSRSTSPNQHIRLRAAGQPGQPTFRSSFSTSAIISRSRASRRCTAAQCGGSPLRTCGAGGAARVRPTRAAALCPALAGSGRCARFAAAPSRKHQQAACVTLHSRSRTFGTTRCAACGKRVAIQAEACGKGESGVSGTASNGCREGRRAQQRSGANAPLAILLMASTGSPRTHPRGTRAAGRAAWQALRRCACRDGGRQAGTLAREGAAGMARQGGVA